jgi:hypothetical protein
MPVIPQGVLFRIRVATLGRLPAETTRGPGIRAF